MARPTSIIITQGLRPTKSHRTDLYDNFGQRALQVSETIILVYTINVYPQTVFLWNDVDRLGTTNQFPRFRRTISRYFWFDFQLLGPYNRPSDVI